MLASAMKIDNRSHYEIRCISVLLKWVNKSTKWDKIAVIINLNLHLIFIEIIMQLSV